MYDKVYTNGGKRTLDFATISPVGAVTVIVVTAVAGVVLFAFAKTIKTLKIKTDKISLETEEKTHILEKSLVEAKESNLAVSRDITKKQGSLAKTHIMVIAGDLRELFATHYNLTQKEKDMVWVLVELFISELNFKILNNFTENHIGHTDAEIETYTRLRAREYTAAAKTFFDMYDWTIPRFRLKDALVDLPPDYLFTRLYIIYKDGKAIEQ